MDRQVSELVDHLVKRVAELKDGQRYLVSICGIPGSGKSSLASKLIVQFDSALASSHLKTSTECTSILVGMDGWHLSRAQLDQLPNSKEAHDRRGAAFTFDGKAFSEFVTALRSGSLEELRAPSFSHALKDPVPDAIRVLPSHRLVVLEGLYCNVSLEPWRTAASIVDERWVVDADEAVARRRLVDRHVLTGVARDRNEAEWRADENDLPNGRWLLTHVLEPARRLASIDDPSWAGNG